MEMEELWYYIFRKKQKAKNYPVCFFFFSAMQENTGIFLNNDPPKNRKKPSNMRTCSVPKRSRFWSATFAGKRKDEALLGEKQHSFILIILRNLGDQTNPKRTILFSAWEECFKKSQSSHPPLMLQY